MPIYETAAQIINDSAIELGIRTVELSNPQLSSDPNMQQLCRLLKGVGRDIIREHRWSQAQTEYTFATVNGTASYDLPSDFLRMIDQTGWNRSSRLPLGGPLDPQEWQYIQAIGLISSITAMFRPKLGKIYLSPTPTSAQTIAFEYMTASWVKPSVSGSAAWTASTSYNIGDQVTNNSNIYICTTAGVSAGSGGPTTMASAILDGSAYWDYRAPATATGLTDNPRRYDDLIYFDSVLMTRGLKLAMLKAKSMDTTTAQQDYDRAWAQVTHMDTPGRVLNIGGRRTSELLSYRNIPGTGWGT